MGGKCVGSVVVAGFLACVCPMIPVVGQSVAAGAQPNDRSGVALITMDVRDEPVDRVLRMIARQAGLELVLPLDKIPARVRVTLQAGGITPVDAFARALAGTGLHARVAGSTVVFSTASPVAAAPVAQGGLTGHVVDGNTKQGLRGATVSISGTNKGTTTSDDGAFRFSGIVPGSYTIQVRMLGYVKTTQTVTIAEGQTVSIEVALESSVNALDQVVVTGTVVATAQREVPNAMTVITAKEIEQRGITRIEQLFRGDVPGLFVQNRGSSALLDEASMFSRGATALPANNGVSSFGIAAPPPATTPIKTYLDGVELADPKYLGQIDPKSIERIEIVTGPQSSTIYGSNAINGVMQIFTKRSTQATPQLTVALLSGLVENDFRPTRTPQHDYSAQVNGTEGHIAYSASGSWNYIGPWTPAKQTTRTSGSSGVRIERGRVSADASIRLSKTVNQQRGRSQQEYSRKVETGNTDPTPRLNVPTEPQSSTLNGQTLGLTVGYALTSWWSQQFIVGTDESRTATATKVPGFWAPNDTLTNSSYPTIRKSSLRYTTTVQIPVTRYTRATVTAGADQWQSLLTNLGVTNIKSPPELPVFFPAQNINTRLSGHNAGAFVQGQLGLWDATFLTYGLRAEWNPNYGNDAQPNLAPRYGIAHTMELGSVTAKLRASYGRATRPPTETQKVGRPQTQASLIAAFGPYDAQLANPDLGPEFQQGGEGGIELFLGTRGSLVITRYNQTVEGLILAPAVDSVRSLISNPTTRCSIDLDPAGYGFCTQLQNLNVGSVRNQGWELQSSVNLGPLTTRGTYSWTKSRVIGIASRYRSILTGAAFTPGAAFRTLPEHTWALVMTYGHAATMLSLNLNGTGFLIPANSDKAFSTSARLAARNQRMDRPVTYIPINPGYTMADVNATHRFSRTLEAIFEVKNLTNFYQNDYDSGYAVIGRQSTVGLRWRF